MKFHIAPDRLLALAGKHGTPLYVYSGDLIRERYHQLKNAFDWPSVKIHYAMKANFNPAILKLLLAEGSCLDTVSPAEIHLALSVGYSPEQLLYTANHITEDDMREVHELGVRMNLGSLSRLEKVGKAFPRTEICIRINTDVIAGAHEHLKTGGELSKFGILLDYIDEILELTTRYKLKVTGLHQHTGSQIYEGEEFFQGVENLLGIATVENFPDLQFIDFGGGFGVPYHPDEGYIDYNSLGKKIVERFGSFCEGYGRELELYFEPGKFLVAESGYLLIEVNTLKDNRGKLFAGTNSGFSQLMRPKMYGSYHHIDNISNMNGEPKVYGVCGNICESGDWFAEERPIQEISEGDVLALHNAGAYCYAMGSIYNLRGMPAEVLVDGKSETLARKKLSNKEIAESHLGECP